MARTVGRNRQYEWRRTGLPMDAEPERFFSVTTILKGSLPNPALIGWGMKSVAEYAAANHRQVSAMLKTVRLRKDPEGRYLGVITDPDAVQSAIDWLKGAPYRERERKANIGSAVHAQAEAFALGAPLPEPDKDVVPYVAAFRDFLDVWQPRIEATEATVYNRAVGYAGTLDAIMELPTLGLVLVDLKTGKDIYPEAALQLAAYRYAEFIGMPDGTEAPVPSVEGCAVLHLREDGWDLLPVIADATVFATFRHCIEVFRWSDETSRGVIGSPMPLPKTQPVRKARAA